MVEAWPWTRGTLPSIAPTPGVLSTTIPTTSGASVTIPAVAGLSTIFTFGPGASASTTGNFSASVTAPNIAPLPSALKRKTQTLANAVPFLYVTLTTSAAVPASAFFVETVLLNGQPTSVPYAAEVDDITASPGTFIASFQGALANSTVQFVNGFPTGTTFQPSHTYLFQFYYITTATAAPSGTATSTASGTATATPTATATSSSTATTAPTTATGNYSVGTGVLAQLGLPSVNNVTGVVSYGGFSSATTLTVTSTAGVPSGIATPAAASNVFLSVGITGNPAVTMSGTGCTSSCTSQTPVVLTLPSTIAASAPYFKVYECNATACPIGSDFATLPLTNGNTLTVTNTTFTDIKGFSTTPVTLEFLTSTTP